MNRTVLRIVFAGAAILLAGCSREGLQESSTGSTRISISLPGAKTSMGELEDGHRKLYWSEGDRISANGVASAALGNESAGKGNASFDFDGILNAPFRLLYPASFYKDAGTITLPATQEYAEGSFATNTVPLAGYAENAFSASLGHVGAVVHFAVKKDAGVSASSLSSVTFRGNAGEQLSGDFAINYEVPSISGLGGGSELSINVNQALSESTALDIYIFVPGGVYADGFTVVLQDNQGRSMTKVKSSETDLSAGKLLNLTQFTFVPSNIPTPFGIDDLEEEVLPMDSYNITGRVVDNGGTPIEGVVVSDGLQCVRTYVDGTFYMQSGSPKFVYISTPDGYMPQVSGGIPRFYKLLSDYTATSGIYNLGDFVLDPLTYPDHLTILVTADPQPRQFKYTLDRIAYKSLDVCQDMYQELYDVATSISGRTVLGICLGDIVHEDMSLYANYASALGTLAYPTYNIIGNHDNDYDGTTDDECAEPYESYFGPRNYSFNLGGFHFVMLDNLIMKDAGGGVMSAYDQGLTDDIWTWLQADMAYIPTSTKIMVCAHSPMFKLESGSERTNSAYHAGTHSSKDGGAFGYGDLFDNYSEVHAWAGHVHSGFNYVYPSGHRHKRIQVHTLARSTGELWTNEYLCNGTPRGFTIVEIDNGEVTWKFHPTTRQRGAFQGVNTGYCSAGAPAYDWRDWDYSSKVAVMRDGSGALTEEYQMHVYPRGSYGDNYVYANIFLYDENWGTPVWTPTGGTPVEMTRINTADDHALIADTEKIYDKADTEFRTWYKTYANKSGGSLAGLDGYTTVATDKLTTIFRAPATASPKSGTVTVTDRFGNVYSRSVSW